MAPAGLAQTPVSMSLPGLVNQKLDFARTADFLEPGLSMRAGGVRDGDASDVGICGGEFAESAEVSLGDCSR